MKELPHLVWIVPAAMLLVALAPLPYGYYTLLRLVVFTAALFLAYTAYHDASSSVTAWAVGFGLLALLFNPLIPVHLTRTVWAPIDISGAGLFAAHWWCARRAQSDAA